MGDITTAQLELTSAQAAFDDDSWEELDTHLKHLHEALNGLTEDEQAPIVRELSTLRERIDEAGPEKGRSIARSIDRQIKAGDPEWNSQEVVIGYAKKAQEMLDTLQARYIPEDEIEEFRSRIAAMLGESQQSVKQRAIEDATPRLDEAERRLEENPFHGLGPHEARSVWQNINALLVNARTSWQQIPADDPDAIELGKRIDTLAMRLSAASAAKERDEAVVRILESWQSTQAEFAGWQEETCVPTWSDCSAVGGKTLSELMPRTHAALHRAWSWHYDSLLLQDIKEQFKHDETVKATQAEVKKTIDDASNKLWLAFSQLLEDGERAAIATERHELEQTIRVLQSVNGIFGKSEYTEAAHQRAQALHDKWEQAVDELDRQGRELYEQLQAEARAAWPGMVAGVALAEGFTPQAAARFQGQTILFRGIYNRSRWDFDAAYDLAFWIDGVPVAGQYEPAIAEALIDVSRRTRTYVDTHIEWDAICVIEGIGKINERVTKELRFADSSEKLKFEEHEPRDCVVMRVVGLLAGAVAVAPNQ